MYSPRKKSTYNGVYRLFQDDFYEILNGVTDDVV